LVQFCRAGTPSRFLSAVVLDSLCADAACDDVCLARDQVADYAERKGWTLAEAERWLSPNLGYDPED
jgi:hypothetical protein